MASERTNRQAREFELDQAIKAIIIAAGNWNIKAFLFAFRSQDGVTTTHFENMRTGAAFNLALSLLLQVTNAEMESKESTTESKQSVDQFRVDITNAVKAHNKRTENLL